MEIIEKIDMFLNEGNKKFTVYKVTNYGNNGEFLEYSTPEDLYKILDKKYISKYKSILVVGENGIWTQHTLETSGKITQKKGKDASKDWKNKLNK